MTRSRASPKTAATEESAAAPSRSASARVTRGDIAAFRRALLTWYRRHARDLPWRRTRAPYDVWLSEILLQQTRMETALPYYQRFRTRFSTVRKLADADLDDVLTLWSGLGYYTRARNLHNTARIIASERDGVFPETADALQELPGIGRYTASAIASIAFGERVPVVDGNVKRVLARLFAIETDIDRSATQRQLWSLAETLLSPRSPGDFNQALMELGARVCRPRNPICAKCPLRTRCAAAARGIQARLPRKQTKKPVPRVEAAAGAVKWNGRYLIVKRPPDGLLGGLWQLPGVEIVNGEPPAALLRSRLTALLGVDVEIGELLGTVRHVFSHRRLELHVYRCELRTAPRTRARRANTRWATRRQLDDCALASVDRKTLALL